MAVSIFDLMNPEFLTSEPDCSEIRFAMRPDFMIPAGVVQGGIVATMLDMAMATAVNGGLSTASFHFEIMRPVREREVTVKGRIVRKGRRIIFAEAEMTNDEGALLARGTQTAVPVG